MQSPLNITSILRRLESEPRGFLVRCGDGRLLVLKLNEDSQCTNVLANEAIGASLISGLGFLCPLSRPVILTEDVLTKLNSSASDTLLRLQEPLGGFHIASEFLGQPQYALSDSLPRAYSSKILNNGDFLGMYLFDIWACQQERRKCLYRKNLKAGTYEVIFVDNSSLFGGPTWAEIEFYARAPSCINLMPLTIDDPRITHWLRYFAMTIPALLLNATREIPSTWYTGRLADLTEVLIARLANLKSLIAHELNSAALSSLGPPPHRRTDLAF